MATYKGKDQIWQDESTTYWFEVGGEIYGVVESGPTTRIVDCDYFSTGDTMTYLRDMVTDEIRQS